MPVILLFGTLRVVYMVFDCGHIYIYIYRKIQLLIMHYYCAYQ